MLSITACSTPSNRFRTLTARTPFRVLQFVDLRHSRNLDGGTACRTHSPLRPPIETAGDPGLFGHLYFLD